jgi:hypothetical protein
VKVVNVLLLSSSLLSVVRTARAQDALRSSISLSPVISPSGLASVDSNPDLHHLGPVRFSLGGYAGVELNDNVNLSQVAPSSDLLMRGGLETALYWQASGQSELRFGSSFGYVHYLKNTQYDHLEIGPASALGWTVGFADGTLTLFDQFSYSQQVLAESAISGLANFPRFNNLAGTRVDWLPGRWAVEAGYSHNDSFSDSTQFQYLNSAAEYFLVRGAFRLAEASQVGLEASSSFTSYQVATQTGNTSLSFGPYLDSQLTDFIHLSLRGGPVLYVFDSSIATAGPGKTLDSYYLGFDLRHQLRDSLVQRIIVQRDVRQGINQGSAYIQELTASYSLLWSLSSQIHLDTSFTYQKGSQPLEVPVVIFPFGTFFVPTTENYDRYGTTLSATWQATGRLATTIAVNHWLRDSNLSANAYTVNSLSLSVNYKF